MKGRKKSKSENQSTTGDSGTHGETSKACTMKIMKHMKQNNFIPSLLGEG